MTNKEFVKKLFEEIGIKELSKIDRMTEGLLDYILKKTAKNSSKTKRSEKKS